MSEEKKTLSQKINEELENRLCLLHELRGGIDSGAEVIGYVYRINHDKTRTSLPPIDEILLDSDFGILHGPGQFQVSYFKRPDIEKNLEPLKTIGYKIGREFTELHKNFCLENNLPCYLAIAENLGAPSAPANQLLGYLNEDRLKAAAGFLGALKLILAPNDNQNLNVILEQNRDLMRQIAAPKGDSIPESILSEAFKMIRAEKKQPDLFDQINQVKQIKDLFFDQDQGHRAGDDSGDAMTNNIINKAMDALPQLLEMFNNSIPKAAQHLKKTKPLEAMALKMNPKLQGDFYQAMKAKFGEQAANLWAKEYGISPKNLIPFKAPPVPVEIVQEAPHKEPLKQMVF
jgi:hypothetical protein